MNSNIGEVKCRNLWSEIEDDVLRREVEIQAEQGRARNWRAIAKKLPGRNNKDCRKRWIKLDGPVKKGPWGQDEDQRLHRGVLLHSNVWTEVAQVVGTRHADQCAKRWLHFLNPILNHSEWTEQEDECLLAEVEKNGRNWRKIVDESLQGRSATDAKNRYTIIQRSQKNNGNTNGGLDRQKPVSLRRRRNGNIIEKESESKNSTCWWSGDEVENILHYNVSGTIDDSVFQLDHAFDELPVSNINHVTNCTSKMIPSQNQQLSYAITQPSIEWQIAQEDKTYQPPEENITDVSASCFRNDSLDNSGDVCVGLSETFFETSTSMADIEAGVALQTPPASSHSRESLLNIPNGCNTTDLRRMVDSEEENVDDAMNEALAWRHYSQPFNVVCQDPSMVSLNAAEDSYPPRNRRSTMILQHMQTDQIERVLELLFSLDSTVDVKIISQD